MAKKQKKQATPKNKELRTESIRQSTIDRIEAKKDKEYFYSLDKDGVCTFHKIRHLMDDNAGVPLQQHWVEFVDLGEYGKIVKNFAENRKRCKKAIKELTPVCDKLKKLLGAFDLAEYERAKKQIQQFEELHRYQGQVDNAELQLADTNRWADIYKQAKDEFDELGKTSQE